MIAAHLHKETVAVAHLRVKDDDDDIYGVMEVHDQQEGGKVGIAVVVNGRLHDDFRQMCRHRCRCDHLLHDCLRCSSWHHLRCPLYVSSVMMYVCMYVCVCLC